MSLVTQQNFFVYEYNVLNEEMHISNYLSTSLYVYLSLYIYNIYICTYAYIHKPETTLCWYSEFHA